MVSCQYLVYISYIYISFGSEVLLDFLRSWNYFTRNKYLATVGLFSQCPIFTLTISIKVFHREWKYYNPWIKWYRVFIHFPWLISQSAPSPTHVKRRKTVAPPLCQYLAIFSLLYSANIYCCLLFGNVWQNSLWQCLATFSLAIFGTFWRPSCCLCALNMMGWEARRGFTCKDREGCEVITWMMYMFW